MITIRDGNNTHQQDLEPPSMVLLYLWDQGPTTLYMWHIVARELPQSNILVPKSSSFIHWFAWSDIKTYCKPFCHISSYFYFKWFQPMTTGVAIFSLHCARHKATVNLPSSMLSDGKVNIFSSGRRLQEARPTRSELGNLVGAVHSYQYESAKQMIVMLYQVVSCCIIFHLLTGDHMMLIV